jgi:Na+-translocating ferredoxin:NAD+ oxidoreductase RnfG subunit
MIFSPVEIKTEDGKTLNGVLLDAEDYNKVLTLLDTVNSDGFKGEDAVFVTKLKNAATNLIKSETSQATN